MPSMKEGGERKEGIEETNQRSWDDGGGKGDDKGLLLREGLLTLSNPEG